MGLIFRPQGLRGTTDVASRLRIGVPKPPRVMILGVRKELFKGTGKKPAAFNPGNKNYAAQLRGNGGLFPTWDNDVLKAPHLDVCFLI